MYHKREPLIERLTTEFGPGPVCTNRVTLCCVTPTLCRKRGVLATFTERRAAVEVLRSSPNAFEREPYERHQIKLEEAGRKLVAAADGVDWRLSIDLGYMQDLPECQTVSDFLRSLHHDPGRGSFNQGCEAQRYGDGSGSGGYRDIRLSGPGFREEVMPSVRCDARVADSHPAHVAAALKAIGAETLS